MRCNNCGWENPLENAKCEKCNAPLTPVLNREKQQGPSPENKNLKQTVREGFENVNLLKETILDVDSDNVNNTSEVVICKNCGYPVRLADTSCPNCGTGIKPVAVARKSKSVAGTINPWSEIPPEEETKENTCSLLIVARDNETIEYQPVLYFGNEIILSRDNTEKGNHTITSKEQAALTYEDGKWFIEDKSVMQTTFLCVGKKKEIRSGDIIMLGNRKFVFNHDDNKEP